jgi:ABC-type branched-subunit amino acid transport system substrate-binding protein
MSAAITCSVAGCGAGRHRVGSLPTLTIYASGPQEGPERRQNLDLIDAERLALRQIANRVGPFMVTLASVDDASRGSGQWSSEQAQANARQVADDPTTIAYIADAAPGAPAESLEALNDAGVLQVNAGETMQDPPQAAAAAAAAGEQLFAAFGPPEVAEVDSQLELMRTQRIRRLLVLSDGSSYGRSVARTVAQRAGSFEIELARTGRPILISDPNLTAEIAGSRTDAIFLGALTSATSITTWNRIAAANPQIKLFGPYGLDTDQFAAATDRLAQHRTFLGEPGLATADLPPAGQAFLADFKATYGHAPQPPALFGYAAMQAVLDAIHEAGRKARDRALIAKIFFNLQALPSVLGTYSIDAAGTATIAPSFIFSTVENGVRVPDRTLFAAAP